MRGRHRRLDRQPPRTTDGGPLDGPTREFSTGRRHARADRAAGHGARSAPNQILATSQGLSDRRDVKDGGLDWFKDAIFYELHVRSFQDSNADGIGDFAGLTRRLPYLQDLGVTVVWLLPFYPSPLRDDGYDIADYMGVHADYGTLDDFRRFLDAAHQLGLRVMTELVMNHTSDQHPWFTRARTSPPGSLERDFYVWSDSPERYPEARIIFPEFERSNWSWDAVAGAYYWHRFYAHQPDLNYDNPAVLSAITGVLDFWFGLGVDGMRLDAVPYLIEREGTHSENLQATHHIVRRLRAHVDATFSHRILLAEANQWPEDAAAYFGDGDESHMVFHFPLMPRLFMAIRQEERFPLVDILAQTPQAPSGCQWALFLRNHDELTLEMVTEEERLYMYHVYAMQAHARINLGIRRRLAPLLGNHRRRIELMHALLFSLQGTPVLYYGDEIGMGDNIYLGDRNSVRTPMQWDGNRNAGFSDANAQRLVLPLIVDDEYHHQSVHVAQQQQNPHSLLWWMKRLIATRRRYQAFGRGDLVLVDSPNVRILAFVRRWGAQRVLVVANLSRFVQYAELDLSEAAGAVPVEAFGRTRFPPIRPEPYALTLGPHAFLWLELTSDGAARNRAALPHLEVDRSWEELLRGRGRRDLEAALGSYLERPAPWLMAARGVLGVRVEHAVPIGSPSRRRWLTILRVTFTSGEPEFYLLPLGCRTARRTRRGGSGRDVIATLATRTAPGRRAELFDAAEDPVLATALIEHVASPDRGAEPGGRIQAVRPGRADLSSGLHDAPRRLRRPRRGSNALIALGEHGVLKCYRQVDPGPSPEVEMYGRLHEVGFRHSPGIIAAFRWTFGQEAPAESAWVGILEQYVENEGEAWTGAIAAARRFLIRAARARTVPRRVPSIVPCLFSPSTPDANLDGLIGSYLHVAERLGEGTARLHRALSTPTSDPAFAPETFSAFSRRSAYQRMRTLALSVLDALRKGASGLPPDVRRLIAPAARQRAATLAVFARLLERPLTAPRIRCHGNLHLGQVLKTGDEFVFIDFEGEPGRPAYERRLKHSPLHDVATMVRSFHYAAHAAAEALPPGMRGAADRTRWLRAWQRRIGDAFVEAYVRSAAGSGLLPEEPEDARVLFHSYLVERALYEIGYELDRGTSTIRRPLRDFSLLLGR